MLFLAGYYEDEATKTVDSLLFGLYGDDGLLHISSAIRGSTMTPPRARWQKPMDWQDQKMVRLNPVLAAKPFEQSPASPRER